MFIIKLFFQDDYSHIGFSVFLSEAVVQRCSVKTVVLEISQNSQENTCTTVSSLIKLHSWNFIKKETLEQVFSCDFCEISKSIVFTEHLWASASIKEQPPEML